MSKGKAEGGRTKLPNFSKLTKFFWEGKGRGRIFDRINKINRIGRQAEF
jgi:hypothetical protein